MTTFEKRVLMFERPSENFAAQPKAERGGSVTHVCRISTVDVATSRTENVDKGDKHTLL